MENNNNEYSIEFYKKGYHYWKKVAITLFGLIGYSVGISIGLSIAKIL